MKDYREKDFDLTGLDDETVEMLAAHYPVNDEDTKNRIMEKFLEKTGYDAEDFDDEPAITVSGTERYHRPFWSKYLSTAAALVLAAGGIFGVMKLGSGLGGVPDPISTTLPISTSAATEAVTETTVPEVTEAAVTTEAAQEIVFVDDERETTAASTDTTDTETTATTDTADTEESGTDTATETTTEAVSAETTSAECTLSNDEIRDMLVGKWIASGEDGNKTEYTFEKYDDGYFGGTAIDLSPENEHGIGSCFNVDIDGKNWMFHFFTVKDNTPAAVEWEGDSLRNGFTLEWDHTGIPVTFTPVVDGNDLAIN